MYYHLESYMIGCSPICVCVGDYVLLIASVLT